MVSTPLGSDSLVLCSLVVWTVSTEIGPELTGQSQKVTQLEGK